MAPPGFVHLMWQSSARHLQGSACFSFQVEAVTVLKGHNLQVFPSFLLSFLPVFRDKLSKQQQHMPV